MEFIYPTEIKTIINVSRGKLAFIMDREDFPQAITSYGAPRWKTKEIWKWLENNKELLALCRSSDLSEVKELMH